MAVVLPFRVPAPAPPERTLESSHLRAPEPKSIESIDWHLPLSAADREALLAALEMALAGCAGNLGAARRMVQAYAPDGLGPPLDALADRVFALGRRPQVDVWQVPIGTR